MRWRSTLRGSKPMQEMEAWVREDLCDSRAAAASHARGMWANAYGIVGLGGDSGTRSPMRLGLRRPIAWAWWGPNGQALPMATKRALLRYRALVHDVVRGGARRRGVGLIDARVGDRCRWPRGPHVNMQERRNSNRLRRHDRLH